MFRIWIPSKRIQLQLYYSMRIRIQEPGSRIQIVTKLILWRKYTYHAIPKMSWMIFPNLSCWVRSGNHYKIIKPDDTGGRGSMGVESIIVTVPVVHTHTHTHTHPPPTRRFVNILLPMWRHARERERDMGLEKGPWRDRYRSWPGTILQRVCS